MRIGCKTGGPGDGVSYRGSHGQTVRVGRSGRSFYFVCTSSLSFPSCFLSLPIQALHRLIRFLLPALQACNPSSFPPCRSSVSSYPGSTSTCSGLQSFLPSPLSSVSSHPGSTSSCPLTPSNLQSFLLSFVLLSVFLQPQH